MNVQTETEKVKPQVPDLHPCSHGQAGLILHDVFDDTVEEEKVEHGNEAHDEDESDKSGPPDHFHRLTL